VPPSRFPMLASSLLGGLGRFFALPVSFFFFFFRKSNVFFSSIKGLPPPAWKRSFWRCSEFRKSSHSSPPNFGRFCPGLSLPFVGSVAIKPSNSPPPCKFVAGAKIEVVENRTHTRRGENQSDEEMMMK
jgi:hypothetical protein